MPPTSKPIILVNSKDLIVGHRVSSLVHCLPVPLHRAISVVILSRDGKRMLLQKRAEGKVTWPGYWTNACCTHPFEGESVQVAAERRLKEEMGFEAPLKEMFSFVYEAKYDETWGEHEFDHVFVGEYDGVVNTNPDEVSEYKWVEVKELKTNVKKNPGHYTPWFRIILEKLNSKVLEGY